MLGHEKGFPLLIFILFWKGIFNSKADNKTLYSKSGLKQVLPEEISNAIKDLTESQTNYEYKKEEVNNTFVPDKREINIVPGVKETFFVYATKNGVEGNPYDMYLYGDPIKELPKVHGFFSCYKKFQIPHKLDVGERKLSDNPGRIPVYSEFYRPSDIRENIDNFQKFKGMTKLDSLMKIIRHSVFEPLEEMKFVDDRVLIDDMNEHYDAQELRNRILAPQAFRDSYSSNNTKLKSRPTLKEAVLNPFFIKIFKSIPVSDSNVNNSIKVTPGSTGSLHSPFGEGKSKDGYMGAFVHEVATDIPPSHQVANRSQLNTGTNRLKSEHSEPSILNFIDFPSLIKNDTILVSAVNETLKNFEEDFFRTKDGRFNKTENRKENRKRAVI